MIGIAVAGQRTIVKPQQLTRRLEALVIVRSTSSVEAAVVEEVLEEEDASSSATATRWVRAAGECRWSKV